jgi:short-subunit dehydrogenase
MRALFKDLDLQVLRNLMDVNFWGAVYCTKYALPELLKQQGSVVGVSSIAGYRGLPGRTGYSASKFALNGFLEALRVENLKTGLHVMVASPGFTSSNIRKVALVKDGTAQGETSMDEDKMMSSGEVAQIIVKGIEQRKRSLIMTSQGKLTVFLNKLLPAWLDGMVYNHFTKEKDPLIK